MTTLLKYHVPNSILNKCQNNSITLRTFKGGLCSTYVRNEKCIQNFCWKFQGKRPLGRSKCRWEDDNSMDLREIGRKFVGWTDLSPELDQWEVLVKTVMNLRIP